MSGAHGIPGIHPSARAPNGQGYRAAPPSPVQHFAFTQQNNSDSRVTQNIHFHQHDSEHSRDVPINTYRDYPGPRNDNSRYDGYHYNHEHRDWPGAQVQHGNLALHNAASMRAPPYRTREPPYMHGYHDRKQRAVARQAPFAARKAPPPPRRNALGVIKLPPPVSKTSRKKLTPSPYSRLDAALNSMPPSTALQSIEPSTLYALSSEASSRTGSTHDAAPAEGQSFESWSALSDELLIANDKANPRDTGTNYVEGSFMIRCAALQLTYTTAANLPHARSAGENARRVLALKAVCLSEHFAGFCKLLHHINGYLLFLSRRLAKDTAGDDADGPPVYDDASGLQDGAPQGEGDANAPQRAIRRRRPEPADLIRSPVTGHAVHASALAYNPTKKAFMWPPRYHWVDFHTEEITPSNWRTVQDRVHDEMERKDPTRMWHIALMLWSMSGMADNSHLSRNPPRRSKWDRWRDENGTMAENSPNNFRPEISQRYHQVHDPAKRYKGSGWTKTTTPFP